MNPVFKLPDSKMAVPIEPLRSENFNFDKVLEAPSEHHFDTFNSDLSESRRPRATEPPQAKHRRHRPPLFDRTTLDYDEYIYRSPIVEILRHQNCAKNNPHQDTNKITDMTYDKADRPNTDKRDVDPGIFEAQNEDDENNIRTQKGCPQEKDPGNRRSRVPPDQPTFGASRDAVQQEFSASHNAQDVGRVNMVGNHNVQDTVQDNVTRNHSTQEGIRQGIAANQNTLRVTEQSISGNGNVQTVRQRNTADNHTGQSNTHVIYGNQNNTGVPHGGPWMWPCICAMIVLVHTGPPHWLYTKSPF